jgi:PAS domain S-box-containing protein
MAEGDMTTGGRLAAAAALLLIAALCVADLAVGDAAVLIPLLVVAPLLAATACPAPLVGLVGVLAVGAAIPLGAADGILGEDRHLVYLGVVAFGAAVSFAVARTRARLVALREVEAQAHRRIALLDRSSSLIAAPMDFSVRLEALARLVTPDVADLAVIDLIADDGRLEGVIAASEDPEMADLVRRTRERWPIDPAGEHPVAMALRTGEPQLRGAMSDEDLERYATSAEHLAVMRSLRYRSAVVVPLIARGHTLGVLSVLRCGRPVPFDDADGALMSDLASRAAVAIDNARLFEERRAAEARLQAVLDDLAEAVIIVGPQSELTYVNQAAAELVGFGSPEETLAAGSAKMYADFDLLDEWGAELDPDLLPTRRVLAGEDPPPLIMRRRHRVTGEERWLRVKANPVLDPLTSERMLAVNVIEDVTGERRISHAAAFLSDATKLLASSLEYEDTLQAVAQAAVPQIADWCAVDLVDRDGAITHVALAHVEPAKHAIATELRERYPQPPDAPVGVPQVARTGRSELYADLDPKRLEPGALDERHLELMRALEMTSVLIVPMTSGERTIGTITFVTTSGPRRLGDADRDLAEELGRRAGVAVEHARVHRERSQIAATLQRSLLPPRLPVVPGLTLAARFRAAGEANQVGGDFYDIFPVADGWLVVIGDVTGKGPDAAAITSLARYTIRTAAMYEPSPEALVRRLNEALISDGDHQQMCTAVCLRITPGGAGEPIRVELVCAGHPAPYLLRGPAVVEALAAPGPLLGAFAKAEWTPLAVDLAPGDGILLYTDGVTDARGADGRFGQERLEALLRDTAGGSADDIAITLDSTLLEFQEGPQRDDVALLVLRADAAPAGAETSVVAGSSPVLG